MRFGYFDDKNREYVITTPKTPYPWINYLGSENFFALDLAPGGRLLLLPRRAAAAPDALPLQQRAHRRRRPLLLHQRRRRRLEPQLRAGQDASSTRFECRHGLGYTRITGERKGSRADAAVFVPLGHTAEIHQVTLNNERPTAKNAQAVLVRRVLPVERPRRHDQLPAQLQHRRGRGRATAARSTTRPSTASAATTTRSTT